MTHTEYCSESLIVQRDTIADGDCINGINVEKHVYVKSYKNISHFKV